MEETHVVFAYGEIKSGHKLNLVDPRLDAWAKSLGGDHRIDLSRGMAKCRASLTEGDYRLTHQRAKVYGPDGYQYALVSWIEVLERDGNDVIGEIAVCFPWANGFRGELRSVEFYITEGLHEVLILLAIDLITEVLDLERFTVMTGALPERE